MTGTTRRRRIGELRPSQLLYTYGVGAIVDLPNISAMVMGLDDWDVQESREIGEERLLAAVQQQLGGQVERLLAPPVEREEQGSLSRGVLVGVPVAPFPRWMLCPACRRLAPLSSGLFRLKSSQFRPGETRYVHANCSRTTEPTVLPARFLVACARGHLDDFPWVSFVHRGDTECQARLRLDEHGVSGEAVDIRVRCELCNAHRAMSDAFGEQASAQFGACTARCPHLRSANDDCDEPVRAILLGASNSWFPIVLTALSIPATGARLERLVSEHWPILGKVQSQQNVELLRQIGQLGGFHGFDDAEIWTAIETHRAGKSDGLPIRTLKAPEWAVFANPDPTLASRDFRLREVPVPDSLQSTIARVVIADRLREVKALVGFTRLESPGEFDEPALLPEYRRGQLTRRPPNWLPASEVRGEGIFIAFREDVIEHWLRHHEVRQRDRAFRLGHRRWREARRLEPVDDGYPGLRFVLLHSFAHALLRQFALEAGYAMASIRERIYALDPDDEDGPMAGVLLYTAAPDSEGTLGGLARLGTGRELERHIDGALEQLRFCASDPLCASHIPDQEGATLHGAACHGCLYVPETSCERGNRYLDRALLVNVYRGQVPGFFVRDDGR